MPAPSYPRRRRTIVNSEGDLTLQIARHLQLRYPDVLFHVDYGSGLKMTMGQAIKNKRLNKRSWPDIFIAAARGGKCGLFIELKTLTKNPYLKNGKLSTNPHVQEQAATLNKLHAAGYAVSFGVGYDNTVAVIDKYLRGAILSK